MSSEISATKNAPRVSIGLPVYNGEKYLEEALRSLLGQTFRDFELVIADNNSSDRTGEICRAWAQKDRRIRYYRNATNIGGSRNHNRAFELASGQYFMWAAYDDVRSPEYLARCVEVLDGSPTVVVCFTKTRYIDESGQPLTSEEFKLKVDGGTPHERFREVIKMHHMIEPIMGLIRSDILKKTPLEGQYADCDRVLLAELSLYGTFHEIPEYLFFRRDHPMTSTRMYPSRQQRTAWFDPGGAGRIVFPHFRQFREYLVAIQRVRLPAGERYCCYRHMLGWVVHNRKRLQKDLTIACKDFLRPCVRWLKTVR